MKFKRLGSLGSAFVLTISTLLTFGLAGTAFAAGPYTCTWTGATNDNFSTAGNWSGCNMAAPQPGDHDNLVFNSSSLGVATTLNNDITSLALTSITFSGSNSGYYDFILTGNAISLSGGIVVGSSDSPKIDTNLTLTASQSFTGGGFIELGDNSHTPTLSVGTYTLTIGSGSDNTGFDNVYGAITGSGSLVAQSGSQLLLDSASSGWTGSIAAEGTGFISGNLGDFGSASSVTIPNGSAICIGGYNGGDFTSNLTVGGTDAIITGSSCGDKGGGSPLYDSTASVDFTGTVTLTADTTISTIGTVTISGPISGNYTIGLDTGEVGNLVIDSSSNTSQSANGNVSSPVQVITIAAGDDQPSDQIYISDNVEYIVDGVRGDAEVQAGGILKGTGTVASLALDAASGSTPAGIVSPGDAPGCITVDGNLIDAGTYQAEIGGTTACSGYDQLVVTGIVTLNDKGTPLNSGILDVSLINGFTPKAGQTFEIINNQSSSPVSGTFSGLPEGSEITVSGYVFKISYVGGTGNDVVLTVVSVPKTPSTGMGLTSAHVGLPILGAVMMAGGVYFSSSIIRKKRLF